MRLAAGAKAARSARRVGPVTAACHEAVAKYRGSLSDDGHEVQLALELALRVKCWPSAPKGSLRRSNRQGFSTAGRCFVMDSKGRAGVGSFVLKRVCRRRKTAKGSEEKVTFYVFKRRFAKGRLPKYVAVPREMILAGSLP